MMHNTRALWEQPVMGSLVDQVHIFRHLQRARVSRFSVEACSTQLHVSIPEEVHTVSDYDPAPDCGQAGWQPRSAEMEQRQGKS